MKIYLVRVTCTDDAGHLLLAGVFSAETLEQGLRRALNERLPYRETWIDVDSVELEPVVL
jgi:hypothetical protein